MRIKNDAEHAAALAEIERLIRLVASDKAAAIVLERLAALAEAVARYEDQRPDE